MKPLTVALMFSYVLAVAGAFLAGMGFVGYHVSQHCVCQD